MEQRQKISILLSAYNEPINMIRESIHSVLNQTYKNLQVILINDNPSRNELDELLLDYVAKDSRITYIFNEENIGLVSSLNKGLRLVSGEYVARMDADDISLLDRIECQLAYLNNNNCDLIGCNIIKIDEDGNELDKLLLPASHEKIAKYMQYGSCVLHPTWFGKTEVFKNLEGYRNIYSCEDFDFLLRAMRAGYVFGNLPEIKLKYRIRTNGISVSSGIRQKLTTYYLIEKYNNEKQVSVESINSFIRSNEYKSKYRNLEKYEIDKGIIKESTGIISKLNSVFHIIFNIYFYKNIVEHLKIKERTKYSK